MQIQVLYCRDGTRAWRIIVATCCAMETGDVNVIDNACTDGEQLCNFVNHRLLASAPWSTLASGLEFTGRHSELIDFYRQITAVGLTGRLVSAGLSLAETIDVQDPAFKKELITFFRDYIGIPHRFLDEAYRFTNRAVMAALEPLRGTVRNQLEAFAMRTHPHCYMCGVSLNFDHRDTPPSYTCEHVWPRGYGGNSFIENLLPACYSCNTIKKANFATWAMPAIQSLILGLSPTPDRLQEIPGTFKFAIHYRAAQQFAIRQHATLKNAFLRLGPWEDVRIRDVGDIVDVFNLENHAADRAVA